MAITKLTSQLRWIFPRPVKFSTFHIFWNYFIFSIRRRCWFLQYVSTPNPLCQLFIPHYLSPSNTFEIGFKIIVHIFRKVVISYHPLLRNYNLAATNRFSSTTALSLSQQKCPVSFCCLMNIDATNQPNQVSILWSENRLLMAMFSHMLTFCARRREWQIKSRDTVTNDRIMSGIYANKQIN